MQDTEYRLEYSERDGCFHYENPENNNKNTNTYFCICDKISRKQCSEFTGKMFKKYPNIKTGNERKVPTFETIKKEF